MPRRTIQPREYGRLDGGTQRRPPSLSVRWGARGTQDVQVGLSTPDEGGPGTGQHHVIDYWYGDAPTLTRIASLVLRSLDGEPVLGGDLGSLIRAAQTAPDSDTQAENLAAIGRTILDAVTGSSMNGDVDWWTDLDRAGCQDAIRWLRKARDDSYGRDE